ncbi:DUF4369 domain-containing protein [Hydrotalea flava]|uniref:DUF4369 domain-containing protein n=1 Tax=Hydrotalea flava TaxID=714549 RepID=UPI00142EDDD1|nr:DUF4369 domain-containing protein [Hydrotalea flava]
MMIDYKKWTFLTNFLLFTFPFLFAQQETCKPFTIQGTAQWPNGTTIYLQYVVTPTQLVTDSCKVINHRFYFKGCITEPVMATCSIGPLMNAVVSNEYCDIFLSPASMQLTIPRNNIYNHSHLSGSVEDSIFSADRAIHTTFLEWRKPLQDSMLLYQKTIQKAVQENNATLVTKYESLVRQLQEKLYVSLQQEKNADSLLILQHPFSYFTLSWLASANNDMMPLSTVEQMYAAFPDALKKSKNGRVIAQMLDNEKKFAVGNSVPDFIVNDTKGNTYSFGCIPAAAICFIEVWGILLPALQEIRTLSKKYRFTIPRSFNNYWYFY